MDFYRNIDKVSDLINGATYSQVLDVQRAAVVTEPVTLADIKEWAKVDVTGEDGILTALITAAREMCEKYTNVNFVQRQVTALVHNGNGGIYLPYGPIGSITSVTNEDGDTVDYDVTGIEFKCLLSPKMRLKLIYQGGYVTLPESLKTALKAQALFLFENRGESDFKLSPVAKGILSLYRRV
jgi:hypothetical protein